MIFNVKKYGAKRDPLIVQWDFKSEPWAITDDLIFFHFDWRGRFKLGKESRFSRFMKKVMRR